MSEYIIATERIWVPGPKDGSHVLVATPGMRITVEEAAEWGVNDDGTMAGDGPDVDPGLVSQQETTRTGSDASVERFPTSEEIAALDSKALQKLNKTLDLGVPAKMKIDDKRVAVAGAVEELALELKGLEGLTAEEVTELEALAAETTGD
ncbi:MAG: hypothetical protein AAGA90_07925 [Actinomycetota bacterium]